MFQWVLKPVHYFATSYIEQYYANFFPRIRVNSKGTIVLCTGYNKTMILYDIEPTDNKRLLFLRELDGHRRHVGELVVITPEVYEKQYSISLSTIQSVLFELEELGHIEIDLRPNRNLTFEQRIRKDDEQDYCQITLLESFANYYDMVERTEPFHRVDTPSSPTNRQDSMTATLSFEGISKPVISIGDKKYSLSSMREGLPFTIISYCLKNHPDQAVEVSTLKAELKAANIKAHGMTNLNENIRRSHFGSEKPLSPFVVASSKGILVKQSTSLNQQQIDLIKAASQ